MAIQGPSTGTQFALTGPHTKLMRYAALIVGLGLEMRTQGRMQMTRGRSSKAVVVDEFRGEKELLKALGIKLNRNTSYEDLIKIVQAKKEAVMAAADAEEAVKNGSALMGLQ